MKLDQIDRKVLDILQSNAKITNAQLSKEIGLSPAPTLERVKKLRTAWYYSKLSRTIRSRKSRAGRNDFYPSFFDGSQKGCYRFVCQKSKRNSRNHRMSPYYRLRRFFTESYF